MPDQLCYLCKVLQSLLKKFAILNGMVVWCPSLSGATREVAATIRLSPGSVSTSHVEAPLVGLDIAVITSSSLSGGSFIILCSVAAMEDTLQSGASRHNSSFFVAVQHVRVCATPITLIITYWFFSKKI